MTDLCRIPLSTSHHFVCELLKAVFPQNFHLSCSSSIYTMLLLCHNSTNVNEVKINNIYHLSFTCKIYTLVQKDVRLIRVYTDFVLHLTSLLNNFVPGFFFKPWV